MKIIKKIVGFEFLLMLIISIFTFKGLYENIDKLGTSDEWRFYFALISFILFFLILISLIFSEIINYIVMKKIRKKQI